MAEHLTEASDVPDLPGLPRAAVDPWLREHVPALGSGPWTAEVISGGLSNITYGLRSDQGDLVLRRGPLGRALPSAHDMRREARVITGLGGSAVPVPRVHALCLDDTVIGGVFYVMDRAPGVVLRTAEDTAALSVPVRATIGQQLIDVLADLHGVDPDAVGLGDFGRPAGYLQRQLKRWGEQWRASRTRDLPDMDRLLDALAGRLPENSGAAIVHGDYRLDNTLVDLTGEPRITAVLDWELSTLGDPLSDLALALAYWHDAGDDERERVPVASGVTAHEGFPTAREFAEGYARRTGADLSHLPVYLAMADMKLAVILEGVHFRHLGGQTVGHGYEGLADSVPVLVSRGLRALADA